MAGGKGDFVFADVAGFHANHAAVFFIAEIGHGFGFGDPWVPDHAGGGAGFFHQDFPAEVGIVDFHGAGGVGEDTVDFGTDAEGVAGFLFAGEVIHLVDVGVAFETGDGNLADIADGKISVEAVFDGNGAVAGIIGGRELHREFVGDADDEFGAEVLPFRPGGGRGKGKEKNDGAVGNGGGFDELPTGGAGEAVGDIAIAAAEPGETDGDAAANGFIRGEKALGAHEEERRFAIFLERGDVGAMSVDLGLADGGGDDGFGEAGGGFNEIDAPGNFVWFHNSWREECTTGWHERHIF